MVNWEFINHEESQVCFSRIVIFSTEREWEKEGAWSHGNSYNSANKSMLLSSFFRTVSSKPSDLVAKAWLNCDFIICSSVTQPLNYISFQKIKFAWSTVCKQLKSTSADFITWTELNFWNWFHAKKGGAFFFFSDIQSVQITGQNSP